jgi:dUTP pyrophosphatase
VRYAAFDENVDIYPPVKGSTGAAGWDLLTAYQQVIPPHQMVLVRTNLVFEIPVGFVGKIYPRSSTAKTPLRLANSVGIIDSDYRGEIMFAYENIGDEPYTIHIGDKIGQILFERIQYLQFDFVDRRDLTSTTRGEGGFGSTGR